MVGIIEWFMTSTSIFRKDARLPEQLQRAMAAEAEASREARAKVRKGRIRSKQRSWSKCKRKQRN